MKTTLRDPLLRVSRRETSLTGAQAVGFAQQKRRHPGALLGFLMGSFVAHGVAYAALSSLPTEPSRPSRADLVELAFFDMEEPAPEPVALPVAPEPTPVVPVARVRPAPKPVQEAAPVEAHETPQEPVAATDSAAAPGPAPLDLGSSTEGGLAVAGRVGSGSSNGNGTGNGGGGAVVAPKPVDLGALASEWTRRVNLAISSRALRDYPRSAVRARLEGGVLLAVEVDINGRLTGVTIKQSSGHPQLDEAALAAARALGELPAPPEALRSYLRPIRIPINYRVQ